METLLEKSVKEKFKVSGISLPVSPQVAGECLMSIYQKNHHQLTPSIVVEEARSKRHPLHVCFEWNDTKAAKKWRLEQARKMIQCVTVVKQVDENKKVEVRAFVNIREEESGSLTHNPFNKGKTYYMSVNDTMVDEQLRKYTVDIALRELSSWMDKYNNVKELASLYKIINKQIPKYKKRA